METAKICVDNSQNFEIRSLRVINSVSETEVKFAR